MGATTDSVIPRPRDCPLPQRPIATPFVDLFDEEAAHLLSDRDEMGLSSCGMPQLPGPRLSVVGGTWQD